MHRRGMRLLIALLDDSRYGSTVLPMIRMLGKPVSTSYTGFVETYGSLGQLGNDYSIVPDGSGTSYYSHCELSLQCASEVSEDIWNLIKDWIETNQHGMGFRSQNSHIWYPLGESFGNSSYYAKTCGEILSQSPASYVLSLTDIDHAPWLLKVIWARAGYTIYSLLNSCGDIRLLNPSNETQLLKDVIQDSLSCFDPSRFGIPSSSVVDPTRLGVSHMTMHALNSITSTRPNWALIQHYPQLRDPYVYPSLAHMLSGL
jgi:hypothetical protein